MQDLLKASKLIKYTLIPVVLLLSLSFIFWGRGTNDSFYWLGVFNRPLDFSLSDGTWIVGHFWCECFGYSILPYRILVWICCIFAICVPYFVFYPREQWTSTRNLLSLELTVFLMGYGTLIEFSPGTLTFLTLSLTISFMIRWHRKKNLANLAFLGAVSALAVFCRFPNVVSIAIVALYIFISCKNKGLPEMLYAPVVYILVTFIVYYLLFYITHKNFQVLYNISSAFSQTSTGGHSLSSMIHKLFNEANELIVYSGLVILISFFPYLTTKFKNRWISFFVSGLGVILLAYVLRSNVGTHVRGNRNLHEFISAICILLSLVCCFSLFIKKRYSEVILLIFSLLVLMVEPLGSDTGWVKLFPALLVLLPLLLPSMDSIWNNKLAWVMVLGFCAYAGICFANNNLAVINRDGFAKMNTKSEAKVLSHIWLSEGDVEQQRMIIRDFHTYGIDDNTIYYGFAAHFFYALTETPPVYSDYGFWMAKDDPNEIAILAIQLRDKHSVLFDLEKNDSDFFLDMIDSIGYDMVFETNLYKVYKEIEPETEY